MGNPFIERHSAKELASGRQVIEIAEKISSFDRLSASIEADLNALDPDMMPAGWRDLRVSGRLEFGFAGIGNELPAMRGEAEVETYAVCQRCLEPMIVSLRAELKYLLADGEHDDYEVWELEESTMRPIDIVDEALVMAIPISVLHVDSEDCRRMTVGEEPAEEKIRPFAALRAQMDEENSAG